MAVVVEDHFTRGSHGDIPMRDRDYRRIVIRDHARRRRRRRHRFIALMHPFIGFVM